jgi:hypothetical protein
MSLPAIVTITYPVVQNPARRFATTTIRNLLLLSLLSCAAHADMFTITFTPTIDLADGVEDTRTLHLIGSFTTDGVCTVCSGELLSHPADHGVYPPWIYETDLHGLLSFYIMQEGALWGEFGFPVNYFTDIQESAGATYDRETHTFTGWGGDDFGDYIVLNADGSYHINENGAWDEVGLFSVNAVPEPSSVLLLLPILVCVTSSLKRRYAGPRVGPLKRLNRF